MSLKGATPSNTRAQPSLSLRPRRRAFLCGMLAGADLHHCEHVGATKAQGGSDMDGRQHATARQAPHASAAQAQHLLDLPAGEKHLRVGGRCIFVHRPFPRDTSRHAGTRGTASAEKQFPTSIKIDDKLDDKRTLKRKSPNFSRAWASIWRKGWDSNPRYGRTVHRISSPLSTSFTTIG